jgi:AcrR family transcriptional regulator
MTTPMGELPIPNAPAQTLKKGEHYHHPDLREAMIRVAQELLETEGPSSWTVRAAARIAGVSSGAPYRHFADKDTLLAAVAARGFDELRTEIASRLELADPDPYARFQALGEAYVSFAIARPGRYQIMFGRDILNRDLHPDLCAAADRAFGSLLDEVKRAQRDGLLRDDSRPEALAAGAWAVVHGLADLLLSGRLNDIAEGDTVALTSQLGRMMFEGLLTRSAVPVASVQPPPAPEAQVAAIDP